MIFRIHLSRDFRGHLGINAARWGVVQAARMRIVQSAGRGNVQAARING